MKTHSEYLKSLNLKITHSDSQKVLYLKKIPLSLPVSPVLDTYLLTQQ